jgi:hypothetical protein
VRLVSRIVLRVPIFEAQRTNCRHLGDVLAGLCPVEVPPLAWQNDDASGRIRLDLIAVESIAQADVYPDSARIRRPPLPNGAIRILPNG